MDSSYLRLPGAPGSCRGSLVNPTATPQEGGFSHVSLQTVIRFVEASTKEQSFEEAVLSYDKNVLKQERSDYREENQSKLAFATTICANLIHLEAGYPLTFTVVEDGIAWRYELRNSENESNCLRIERRSNGKVEVEKVQGVTLADLQKQAIYETAKKGDQEALYLLLVLANSSDAVSQYRWALLMYSGCGEFLPDYAAALKYLDLAAQQGHADAQLLLAKMLFLGIKCNKDQVIALHWLRVLEKSKPDCPEVSFFLIWARIAQTAKEGQGQRDWKTLNLNAYSCGSYSVWKEELNQEFEKNNILSGQYSPAMFLNKFVENFNQLSCLNHSRWIEDRAEQGCAMSQLLFAVMFPEETKSNLFLEKAAEQGYAPAQVLLALKLLNNKNLDKATIYFKEAAKQNYAPALLWLGLLGLHRGDSAQALKNLEAAADQGHASAHFLLALTLHEHGKISEAKEHFLLLAKRGYAPAQFWVGAGLRETNPKQAVYYLMSAAKNDHILAQYHLCKMSIDYQKDQAVTYDINGFWSIYGFNFDAQNRFTFQATMKLLASQKLSDAESALIVAEKNDHQSSRYVLWTLMATKPESKKSAALFWNKMVQDKYVPAWLPNPDPDFEGTMKTRLDGTVIANVPHDLHPQILHYHNSVHPPAFSESYYFPNSWSALNIWDNVYIPGFQGLTSGSQVLDELTCWNKLAPDWFDRVNGLMRWNPQW